MKLEQLLDTLPGGVIYFGYGKGWRIRQDQTGMICMEFNCEGRWHWSADVNTAFADAILSAYESVAKTGGEEVK